MTKEQILAILTRFTYAETMEDLISLHWDAIIQSGHWTFEELQEWTLENCIKALENEFDRLVRLEHLVHFCNTGKYPE